MFDCMRTDEIDTKGRENEKKTHIEETSENNKIVCIRTDEFIHNSFVLVIFFVCALSTIPSLNFYILYSPYLVFNVNKTIFVCLSQAHKEQIRKKKTKPLKVTRVVNSAKK